MFRNWIIDKINIEDFFINLKGKTMSLEEFENSLASAITNEFNNKLNILPSDKMFIVLENWFIVSNVNV
jgi:plasmid replication initiation protein